MNKFNWLALIISAVAVILALNFHRQDAKLQAKFNQLAGRVNRLERQIQERKVQEEPRTQTLSVYFTSDTKVEAVKRTVEGEDSQALLEGAFAALLSGPTAQEQERGLSSQLPKEAKLLGVEIEDGIAAVNFSRQLEQVGGTARVLGILKQIGYTATAVPGVRGAWLYIEGKKVQNFSGEGVIIQEPLSRSGGAAF